MAYLGWANSSNNLKDFEDRLGMAMAHANKASEPERLIIESAKAQNDGNVKQAEECLVRAVELRPEGKRARYTLGNFYFGHIFGKTCKIIGDLKTEFASRAQN